MRKAFGLVKMRITLLKTCSDTPNRASPATMASNQPRHRSCSGQSGRKALIQMLTSAKTIYSESIRSARAALLLMSTPGTTPPPALEIGSCTLFRPGLDGFDSKVKRPSSTREVKVRPSLAALRLTRPRSSSFNRIVVLICLDISCSMSVCQASHFVRHSRARPNTAN